MCWQRLRGHRGCGFETVLLPWKLEGSHIKLDQELMTLNVFYSAYEPVDQHKEIGGDKQ